MDRLEGIVGFVKRILKNKLGLMGAIMLIFFLFIALFGKLITPYGPDDKTAAPLESPSEEHLFGSDRLGHDILTLIIQGAKTSLKVAFFSAVLGVVLIGLPVGFISGYFGGKADVILMRFIDAFLSIPMLPLMIVIAAYMTPSIWNLVIVIGITSWARTARMIRAETLQLRTRGYVVASRSFDARPGHMFRWHFLPNLFPLMLSSFILVASRAVIMEAGLAFLGIGDPTLYSWGMTLRHALNTSSSYLTNAFLWRLVPVLFCITLLVLSFTFIGYALEEIFNKRLKTES